MTFWKNSPTSGAQPKVNTVLGTCYVWGSLSLGIYILIMSVYIPFLRLQQNNRNVLNPTNTSILLCIHAFLLLMVGWCYLRVRLTNPGNIPRIHNLTVDELHALESGSLHLDLLEGLKQLASKEIIACELSGAPKYCQTCQIYRPMRTSHCRETGRCVAKFDHYCPLLSSAIGAGNYKYYLHFLVYMCLLAIYLQIMGIFIVMKVQISLLSIMLLVVSSFFADSLIPLTSIHAWMVLNNVTTRESTLRFECWKAPEKKLMWVSVNTEAEENRCGIHHVTLDVDLATKPWSRGCKENWTDVMGNRWWQWLLPLRAFPEFDGKWWDQELNDLSRSSLLTSMRQVIVESLTRNDAEIKVPEKALVKTGNDLGYV
jgi:DHHC palmitoyltransferase